jgi:hypothetical protein
MHERVGNLFFVELVKASFATSFLPPSMPKKNGFRNSCIEKK